MASFKRKDSLKMTDSQSFETLVIVFSKNYSFVYHTVSNREKRQFSSLMNYFK
jgi:hypothetical protein